MVYVDDAHTPAISEDGRRMFLNHMIADTNGELFAMAKRIGISAKHVKNRGTKLIHFEICNRIRVKALFFGAKPLTHEELVEKIVNRVNEVKKQTGGNG